MKFNILAKLIAGFVFVLVLTSVVTLYALIQMNVLAELTTRIYNHPLQVTKVVLSADTSIVKIHHSMKDVALSTNSNELEMAITSVDDYEKEVYHQLAIVDEWILGDEGAALNTEATQLFIDWKAIRDEVIDLTQAGNREQAAAITKGKGAEHVILLNNKMEELKNYAAAKADGMQTEALSTVAAVRNTIAIILVVVVLFSGLFAFYLAQTITGSVQQLVEGTKAFGQGNLAYRVKVNTRDEIAQLAQAFNVMAVERQRAEEQIRFQSEIVENMAEGVNLVSTQDGMIVYANPTFERMFGYDSGELLDKHISIVNAPTEKTPQETAQEIMQSLAEKSFWQGEVLNIKKDNTVFWSHASVSTFEHPQYGEVWISVHEDITERKQTEEALKKSEAEYKSTVNNLRSGVVVHAADTTILLSNPAAHSILGLTEEQMAGKKAIDPAWNFVYEDLTPIKVEEYPVSKVIAAKKPLWNYITGIIKPDLNDVTWVNVNAIPVFADNNELSKIVVNFVDITDRKQAEEALLKTQHLLVESQRMAKLGSWEYDLVTKNIIWSKEVYSIFGLDETYTPSLNGLAEWIHPDDLWVIAPETIEKNTKAGIQEMEYRIIDQTTRKIKYVIGQGETQKDSEGNPVRNFGLFQDITERKQAEEALQARTRELALLNEASLSFVSSLELDQVLLTILDQVRRVIGIAACSVWLVDLESGDLVCREVTSPGDDIVRGWRLAPGQGLVGWVAQHGECLNVPDTRIDERFFKGIDEQTGLESRSILGVPLRNKDRVFGVLELVDKAENRFSPDDVRLAESLSTLASIAIDNAYLYQQTQQDAQTKAMLLKEVNHRVKNNLIGIMGMLYVTQRYAGQAKTQSDYLSIIEDVITRIEGLATVHTMLSISMWSPLALSDLAARIIDTVLQSLPSDKHILVDITPAASVRVWPKQANNLAMVINELTTNTIKYALAERPTARITIRIALEEDESVLFEFQDDGPGFPENVLRLEHHNVGIYLIRTLVQSDLRGKLTLHNQPGAVTTIRFPATVEGKTN